MRDGRQARGTVRRKVIGGEKRGGPWTSWWQRVRLQWTLTCNAAGHPAHHGEQHQPVVPRRFPPTFPEERVWFWHRLNPSTEHGSGGTQQQLKQCTRCPAIGGSRVAKEGTVRRGVVSTNRSPVCANTYRTRSRGYTIDYARTVCVRLGGFQAYDMQDEIPYFNL
jgi:hypothetical protein